ncbi:unnamed protein product [Camellia sinensis]
MYPTYHANNLREMYMVPNYLPTSMAQRHSAQPTFQSLLQVKFAMDNHQQNQTDAEIGLQREVMASEIVKQTAAGK